MVIYFKQTPKRARQKPSVCQVRNRLTVTTNDAESVNADLQKPFSPGSETGPAETLGLSGQKQIETLGLSGQARNRLTVTTNDAESVNADLQKPFSPGSETDIDAG